MSASTIADVGLFGLHVGAGLNTGDGTLSYAANHQGARSHPRGVAQFCN